MGSEAWSETALITVVGTTGTITAAMNIAALTDTIDIDQGDRDIEGVPSLSGGRLVKKTPEGDTTITFEGYPIGIGDSDATAPDGLMQHFFGGTDTTAPFSVTSATIARNQYSVYILWTDDTAATIGTTSIASGKNALRYKFANCYMTSCKASMTDGIVKGTFKFKCPPRNQANTANITVESTDGTASMNTL